MIIYSNGCSHTSDMKQHYDNVYIDILANEVLQNYKLIKVQEGHYNDFKNFSFKKLDTNTNYLLKNASHGKSNDLIFFESYNIIKDSIINNVKLDFVVIQFSGVNRRIHSNSDGSLLNVNPFDNSELGVKFEPFATEQSLQYILILQDLLKKHSIKYCFIPYMEFDSDTLDKSSNLKLIDNNYLTTSLKEGHRNSFRKNGYVNDASGHPNHQGYYILTKIILKKLELSDKINPIEDYFSDKIIKRDKKYNSSFLTWIKERGDVLKDGTNDDMNKLKNPI
jgi:hypothetical protein